ncbi:peptidase inhibitor I78 [Sphingomonas rhizophila]|uniref:Peptidase inhibitor I78 n=1 Tax=Sphingomonas rhizophila TaxID=2071607 RepID=A0A7G9SDN2_9SPHN|nr:I78 family peptidase inhibitor [Sphingomonas rhizophila]QNN65957.1 peptidase inhibitor I78 [Sphingomonas rhizophila]
MRVAGSIFFITLSLAACAAVTPTSDPAIPPALDGSCSNDALGAFVGQKATQDLGTQMLAASGARTLRWVPHGAMVTMEYRADRLTVRLDPANKVLSASCG